MVRVCDGAELPKGDKGKVYLLRSSGGLAHEIWNVADPTKPALLTRVVSGLKDTHKSWWECDTGIAFLVSGVQEWRVRRMTQRVRPLRSRENRSSSGISGCPGNSRARQALRPPICTDPFPPDPRATACTWGTAPTKDGVLQIVDRDKLLNGPKEPTNENLLYPQVGRLDLPPMNGAHTTLPLLACPSRNSPRTRKELRGIS